MANIFQNRAAHAGFDRRLFGFHSFRSGFMCSALIKDGSNSQRLAGILEHTAMVANWKPHGKAQMRYVKEAARATIVATRLINQPSGSSSSNIAPIDAITLTRPEVFHNIPKPQSNWSEDVNYRGFVAAVNKHFFNDAIEPLIRDKIKKKCWRDAYDAFVQADPHLEKEAAKIYKINPRWKSSQSRHATENEARAVVGRGSILGSLSADYSLLDDLVAQFIEPVREVFEGHVDMVTYKRKASDVKQEEDHRERFDESKSNARKTHQVDSCRGSDPSEQSDRWQDSA